MHIVKYLILFFLALFINLTYAQDTGNFTQFFFNPYSINPSFAGIDGRGAIFLAYRKQWAGIEGAPTVSNFSFHAPLNSGVSIGIGATNDKRGIVSNSGLLFTMAYSVSLGESKYIRFGLSGGGAWNTIDLQKLQSIGSDPAIANMLSQNASILGNAGISIHLKSFHLGVAMPNLFAPSYISKDAFTITEIKPSDAFIVHASNRFYFGDGKHVFEPYAVYRINNGLPTQYEVAGVLHLNHVIWLGGSLKQQFGISAFGGIKLNKSLAIGGSYSLKNTGINELNFSSYEVQLSYLGGAPKTKNKNKSKTQHLSSYSFVDTEIKKLTAKEKRQEELAKKAAEEKKAKEALAKKKAEEQKAQEALVKKQDEDKKAQEALAKKEEDEKKALALKEEGQRKTQEEELQRKAAEEAKRQAELVQVKPDEIIEKPVEVVPRPRYSHKEEINIDENDFVESVSHGSHAQELAPGNYVVAGVFGFEEEAKNMVKKLKDENGVNTKYGYISEKGLWYVYPFNGQDIDVARTERDKYRQIPGFNSTWLLKVNAELNVRHEFVEQGDHAQELELGNYVIVGVFSSAPHADEFSKRVKKLGFNPDYGHLSKKGYWYVYIFHNQDINQAKTERDKFHTMPMFRHAWLLTVQN